MMINNDDTTRKRLIQKIKRLSDSNLGSVEQYIDSVEKNFNRSVGILSFAGIFSDLDKQTLDDLTVNLHERRKTGPFRIL